MEQPNKEHSVNKTERPIIKDDEIDLIALAHTIWDNRKTIWYTIAVAVVIGLMVAIFSPVKYTASATILPQAEGKTDLGGLGGLASMAGINLGSMMGSASGIQPDLYPRVINSYPFLNELVHQPFDFEEEDVPKSIYEQRLQDSIPGFGATVMKYTLRLPWTIKNALMGGDQKISAGVRGQSSIDVTRLSEEETGILKSMTEVVTVSVDDETGLVTIGAELDEPLLTAQVTQKTVELLQKYIIEYKTRQATQNLEFIEARLKEKKAEFETAREAFFEYRDRNRNIIEERTNIRYQELSDAYNLASQVYQSLAEQKEQAEIAVKKDTPAFSVIEPVKVPLEKSAPKRSMIILISVFLGGFIGIGLVFGGMVWRKMKEAW
ncbi:Wzz/FepE/Etk N-terminal domain-containing protein [Marinilabilia salmonicolor]|uniref:Putative tyrosine kinase-like protein n=1 Tax=Marinilabilia salmonicolor TaxID=989 RepID=A0A368UMK1_9BACT|nr:Wzz/FepE/Etk N-terminal domain-containing protein [Marinilabilia salmonicolor]RCW30048.1 putative tyrosine kinase-like protein [Marinilabilia salmonicolor]